MLVKVTMACSKSSGTGKTERWSYGLAVKANYTCNEREKTFDNIEGAVLIGCKSFQTIRRLIQREKVTNYVEACSQ